MFLPCEIAAGNSSICPTYIPLSASFCINIVKSAVFIAKCFIYCKDSKKRAFELFNNFTGFVLNSCLPIMCYPKKHAQTQYIRSSLWGRQGKLFTT